MSRVERIGDATLYLGDCREILPTLGGVDLLVTDPPYFLPVHSYVGKRGEGYHKPLIGDISVLQGYFDGLFRQFSDVVQDTGSYYVFCDAKSYPIFWRAMYPHVNHVRVLIWDKKVSYNGYTWRHQHELIAWGEGYKAERIPTGDGDILSESGVRQAVRVHPAQKPVPIMERLISKHANATTVLDPFMGSGGVGVAAIEQGKTFIGIEIEPSFFDTACRRIEAAVKHPAPAKQEALL